MRNKASPESTGIILLTFQSICIYAANSTVFSTSGREDRKLYVTLNKKVKRDIAKGKNDYWQKNFEHID